MELADLPKFNGNGLWSVSTTDRSQQLSLSVYNGNAQLAIFNRNATSKGPSFKIRLNDEAQLAITDILKELRDSPPETRLSFVHRSWDKSGSGTGYVPDYSLVFVRNEQRLFSIEISGRDPTPTKFPLTAVKSFSIGSDEMSAEQNSMYALRSLIFTLEHKLPVAVMLSRIISPNERNRANGNTGSGSYNRPRRDNQQRGSNNGGGDEFGF